MSTIEPYNAPSSDTHAGHGPHVVSRANLLTIYAILIAFTVITYAISKVDLGQYNIWAALAVALIKASLVVLYFMHLRWDSPFNAIVLIVALLFVALFIGLALMDSHSYQPQMKPTPTSLGGP
jgi:cytochrome c oxidase subunit IV